MRNKIMSDIELQFPYIWNNIDDCCEIGYHEWLITLISGDRVIYDDLERTIRNIHKDDIDEQTVRDEFGIRMRKIMLHKGITQDDLSDMTGIQRTQLSNYITGRNSPSFYKVSKLAKALNCSIDDFWYK